MKVHGKNVLITGGALRIGRALCCAFADKGAKLIIHCNNSIAEAEELRSKLNNPEYHKIVTADFSNPESIVDFIENTGHVDILVNSASMFDTTVLVDESSAAFEKQLRVNFIAPVELMKQFARQNKLENGCIINFTDQRTVKNSDSSGSYLLSKKSLADATMLAAKQFAPAIRVNAIAPGPVLPPVWMEEGGGMKKVLSEVPLGKKVDINDLVNSCLFLVENESITGQILFVDGGQHLN